MEEGSDCFVAFNGQVCCKRKKMMDIVGWWGQ